MTAHVEDHRRLASYLEPGHKNHVAPSRTAQQDIEASSALYLPANNHTARINYARIAAAHVIRFTDTLPRSTTVFWMALIAGRYTDSWIRSATSTHTGFSSGHEGCCPDAVSWAWWKPRSTPTLAW
ncbi:hypothetical protein [Methylorubrum aminovorans]